MAIGIILGIVFFILVVAGFIASYAFAGNDRKGLSITSVVFAIAMIFCFILIPFSFHTVDTGKIAVVKHLGEAEDTRNAGTYFDLWVISVMIPRYRV